MGGLSEHMKRLELMNIDVIDSSQYFESYFKSLDKKTFLNIAINEMYESISG